MPYKKTGILALLLLGVGSTQALSFEVCKPSAIAHQHTPKIVLRSVIFSTPKFVKITHN